MIKILLITLSITLVPIQSWGRCANKNEMKALNFKSMQSNMMVGALACDERPNYNKLILRTREEMSDFGDVINAYFKKRYGSKYQDELDTFVTFIANKSTEESQGINPLVYCDQTQGLLRAFLSADSEDLEEFANDNFSRFHGIKSCN